MGQKMWKKYEIFWNDLEWIGLKWAKIEPKLSKNWAKIEQKLSQNWA